MGKDVIIACDFPSAEETFAFLDKFEGKKPFVKIGMELFYAEGPEIVRQIKARGPKRPCGCFPVLMLICAIFTPRAPLP